MNPLWIVAAGVVGYVVGWAAATRHVTRVFAEREIALANSVIARLDVLRDRVLALDDPPARCRECNTPLKELPSDGLCSACRGAVELMDQHLS